MTIAMTLVSHGCDVVDHKFFHRPTLCDPTGNTVAHLYAQRGVIPPT